MERVIGTLVQGDSGQSSWMPRSDDWVQFSAGRHLWFHRENVLFIVVLDAVDNTLFAIPDPRISPWSVNLRAASGISLFLVRVFAVNWRALVTIDYRLSNFGLNYLLGLLLDGALFNLTSSISQPVITTTDAIVDSSSHRLDLSARIDAGIPHHIVFSSVLRISYLPLTNMPWLDFLNRYCNGLFYGLSFRIFIAVKLIQCFKEVLLILIIIFCLFYRSSPLLSRVFLNLLSILCVIWLN